MVSNRASTACLAGHQSPAPTRKYFKYTQPRSRTREAYAAASAAFCNAPCLIECTDATSDAIPFTNASCCIGIHVLCHDTCASTAVMAAFLPLLQRCASMSRPWGPRRISLKKLSIATHTIGVMSTPPTSGTTCTPTSGFVRKLVFSNVCFAVERYSAPCLHSPASAMISTVIG